MSTDYAAEAAKLLQAAARHITEHPQDMRIAEVSALVGNGFASLAHLPEQQVIVQEQFAAFQRTVALSIADGLLSGDRTRHATVWYLANALDKNGIDIEPAIREAVEARGKDFDQVWVHPNTGLTDPNSPQGKVERTQLALVLPVLVDEIISMATSYEQPVCQRAFRLMTALDEAGVNIDSRVDARSRELGRGPHFYATLGHDYDLSKQWIDRRGKRWEHTGSWSDVGGPVMRLDEPDGEHMVLVELIREYGPLHTGTAAPKSPERPPSRATNGWGAPAGSGYSDEPPF